jgi:DNA-binding SARP family transcriptional activator
VHRLLDVDPYDDNAHQTLIRTLHSAGRHGQARRAHQHYASAMRELDVPVQPLATIVAPP